jgi:acyl dehydratase
MPTTIDPRDLKNRAGQDIAVSAWISVEQTMIDAFAEVTGDRQWIHVDAARAEAESPFGTTIAHGFLTLALVAQLQNDALQLQNVRQTINYGLGRVRFPAPVRAGARIRARFRLLAWDEVGETIQLTWHCVIDVEGQPKPALVAEWVLRHFLE